MSISSTLMDKVNLHLSREYPNEGCGVLIGTGHAVQDAIPCTNIWDGPRHKGYEIGKTDIALATAQAKLRGMQVVGFYHSHPDKPDTWSATDAEYTRKGMLYLVTSVCMGKACHTSVYLNGTLVGERLL